MRFFCFGQNTYFSHMRRILFITTGSLLLLGLLVHLYNLDLLHPKPSVQRPWVIAHRGNSDEAPENTLVALRQAIDLGVDFVEFDVHLSQDGVPVLLHDKGLTRTTGAQGAVYEFTLAELKKLDAGRWFGEKYQGEPIPTLAEALALFNAQTQARPLIELKQGVEGRYPGLEEKVLAAVYAAGLQKRAIIQSFQGETLRRLRELDQDITLHKLLVAKVPGLPAYYDGAWQQGQPGDFPGVRGVNPWWKATTRRQVRRIHEQGKQVLVYTVDEEAEIRRCLELGVDGIITNHPQGLLDLLEKQSP